jgi:hypothetical protein
MFPDATEERNYGRQRLQWPCIECCLVYHLVLPADSGILGYQPN